MKTYRYLLQPSRKMFLLFYLGGIIFTIILGFQIVFSGKQESWFLFIESIVHMTILIFLGARGTAFKVYAGERIQTAGYLHTLIGFSVAIGLLGTGGIKIDQPQDLNKMLLAIGSALVSSIIGWSFGTEIAHKEDTSVDKVEQAIEKIVDLTEMFHQLHSVIQGESESLLQTFQQFNSSVQTSSESLLQTFNQLNSLSTNLKSLEKESQKAVNSMSNTAQSVQDVAEDLRKMLILIQQLEELIKYILQERTRQL